MQSSISINILKNKYTNYFIWLIVISIFYYVILDFINIKGISPDLFIILTVWITLTEGRLKGLVAGFVIGLFLDIISANVIGTNALTKTIVAFIASYFYIEGAAPKTRNYKFILIVFLSALLHNLIYFLFFIRIDMQNFILFYLRFALASTAFTAFASIFVVLFQVSSNKIKFNT